MTEPEPETLYDPTERDTVDCSPDVVERLGERGGFRRYRLKGEVARGGMGAILRVWDEDLRRHLAMKRILGPDGRARKESPERASRRLGRFLEEAQVTGQLDHPGIVPVHELGLDDDGRLYFTMKMVRGRTLHELLRGSDPEFGRARILGVVLKICEAMAYAHEKGVVHRDLKPANVMVGRFGEVYVMDWGLARVLDRPDAKDIRLRRDDAGTKRIELDAARAGEGDTEPLVTMDGDVVGTPAYMSPEQARGDVEHIDGRSDVYAVGAILYELLAGHVPYLPSSGRVDHFAVWSQVQSGPPPPLREEAPDAPDELVAICEKAMAREPGDRYASMLELADDLRAFLEGRVVRAFDTGAAAQLKKWVARNRPLALTVLAAVVIAFAVVGGAALRLQAKNVDLAKANRRAEESLTLARDKTRETEQRGRELAAAQERFLQVAGLADRALLADLVASADSLWPPRPEKVPELEAWLAEAAEFERKLELDRANLAELRARAKEAGAELASGEGAGATGGVARRRDATVVTASTGEVLRFASAEERWQHDSLVALVGELEELLADDGLVADVERRLRWAQTIEPLSIGSEEARWRWAEAAESIADEGQCPAYGGVLLPPQLGLLPVGRDPESGLWELAHVLSGEVPERDPETGRLALTEESAIVFVLVPGGTAVVGAQAREPGAPRYDALAVDDESPVAEVRLEPFFLSKFELTQGQWRRFTGRAPSAYGPEDLAGGSLLHPVENVGWTECERVLAEMGLVLPTEAQWEHAARAGTDTPWWTGDTVASLAGAANLSDRAFQADGMPSDFRVEATLNDGFTVHAPVGTFRANPFGLHDVHGNVWEWCRDGYGLYRGSPMRDGDGLRRPENVRSFANRGGGWSSTASFARSSRRYNNPAQAVSSDLGLRPARAVER